MAIDPQKSEKPKLPPFPEAQMNENNLSDIAKVVILINYIDEVKEYLAGVKEYIKDKEPDGKGVEEASAVDGYGDGDRDVVRRRMDPDGDRVMGTAPTSTVPITIQNDEGGDDAKTGGKKKQRKTKKKGGADIDYSKVYNVQGLIENISKSTGKDPIASQSVPAPFSTGSPLQRFGKKEAKSLPNELKNEIIPDYSQDGGKKKKTEKKKMPKKK